MGKFRFSLAGVQRYKDQRLHNVKMDYAAAENEVINQRAYLEEARAFYKAQKLEFREKMAEGLNIIELNNHQNYLMTLQDKIEDEEIRLGQLERKASLIKSRMIEAKVESASLDSLREKKLGEFTVAEKKSEEAFIEEFITNKMFH